MVIERMYNSNSLIFFWRLYVLWNLIHVSFLALQVRIFAWEKDVFTTVVIFINTTSFYVFVLWKYMVIYFNMSFIIWICSIGLTKMILRIFTGNISIYHWTNCYKSYLWDWFTYHYIIQLLVDKLDSTTVVIWWWSHVL